MITIIDYGMGNLGSVTNMIKKVCGKSLITSNKDEIKFFNVDKRKHHLSTLILSGHLEKDEVLKQLKEIPYLNELDLIDDIEYFLKKMGWSKQDFMTYLKRKEKSHLEYGSEKGLWDGLARVYKFIKAD